MDRKDLLCDYIVQREALEVDLSGNGKRVFYYTDQHEGCHMSVPVSNGVMSGTGVMKCQNGVVIMKVDYKFNLPNGMYKKYINGGYEEGKVMNGKRNGVCYTVIGSTIVGCAVVYKEGSAVGKLSPLQNNYWAYYTIDSNDLLYISTFDDQWERHGNVIFCKDNHPLKIMKYDHGRELFTVKEFTVGSRTKCMKELDENGICIYEGEYLDDFYSLFPRSGYGKEYYPNPDRTELLFKGRYSYGLREIGSYYVNGSLKYVGSWKYELPHGRGSLYQNGIEEYHNIECMLGFAFLSTDNNHYRDIITSREYNGVPISNLDLYKRRFAKRKQKESR